MTKRPVLGENQDVWLEYRLHRGEFIKKLTARFPGLFQSLGIVASYTAWTLVFKVLAVTFVTYFIMTSASPEGSRFEEVNEALSSSEIAIFALCSFGFLLLGRLFGPYATAGEQFPVRGLGGRIEKQFVPGFLHGSVLAVGVVLAFLISGIYRYLGFFVQIDHAPIALASLLFRTATIAVLVVCEEFIFRQKILIALTRRGPISGDGQQSEFWNNLAAAAFTGMLYVGLKLLQFDLGWMQAITLFLISIALAMRSLSRNGFMLAAGFWSALLIVFHVLLSLPVLGHDFSGLVLIKYQAAVPEPSPGFWQPDSTYAETLRFLTGGAGGPLSSFAFQLLVCFDIFRGALRYRRKLIRSI